MIEKLLELQRLDVELDQLKASVQIYPDKLDRSKKMEESKRKSLDAAKAKLAAFEKEKGELEETLALEEQRLKKSKVKVNELKTSYEFSAMQREIENTRRSNEELEEKIKARTTDIENSKKLTEDIQAEWAVLKAELDTIQAEVDAKMGEFNGVAATQDHLHKDAESGIDRAILSKYRMIRQRKYRDAVVAIVDTACQGCFMNIPHQIVNEMLRNKNIEHCPNCHRLVYIPEKTATA